MTELEFREVYTGRDKLPLPSKESCARHSAFSDTRDAYQKRHEAYQQEAAVLSPMVRNLDDAGIRSGEAAALLQTIMSKATWDKVLSFDCFKGRYPEPSRFDPNSVYDEICGIECTYANLCLLPKPPGRQTSVRMKFVPKAQKAKVLFDQLKTFMEALERPQGKPFVTGRLGEMYELSAKIMEKRSALIESLRDRRTKNLAKGAALTRDRIVAGYFAEYFADSPSYSDLRALSVAVKTLKQRMIAMNEQYEAEPDPEKQLEIRRTILASGLPGDEAVWKHWMEVAE